MKTHKFNRRINVNRVEAECATVMIEAQDRLVLVGEVSEVFTNSEGTESLIPRDIWTMTLHLDAENDGLVFIVDACEDAFSETRVGDAFKSVQYANSPAEWKSNLKRVADRFALEACLATVEAQ